jgi:hypothetical protein
MRLHPSVRARVKAALAAAAFGFLVANPLYAASDTEIRPTSPPKNTSPREKKIDEIMVPIPGWSPEVASNGCHVRQSADELAPDRRPGVPELPFWALIEHAVRRYAVRAVVDPPEEYLKKVAALDDDLRRLALVFTLWEGFGREGLHTFFFLRGGAVAPAIRDALNEAGLAREFALFSRAMALFGQPYPVANEEREKLFGYSRPGGRLNAFDDELLAVSREFGSRQALAQRIAEYVNGKPALFGRIEGLRAKLGENDRLRFLTDALLQKVDWSKAAADVSRQLALLPAQERHLIALWTFNMEFENGGVHQFFYNSSGDLALEAYAAMVELGLDAQAEIFRRALAMFGEPYIRDNAKRRAIHFKGEWSDWDKKLSAMTDEFYAIGGGAKVYRIKGDLAFEGGPGIRQAVLAYARRKNMLPC